VKRSIEEEIVENCLDCVCVHDAEGVILRVNPAFLQAVEAESESEVVGSRISELLDPAVASQFADYLANLRRTGRAEGRMRVRTRSGRRRVFEYRNTLENGVAFGVARDITEALNSSTLQARSERWFRTLFDKSQSAVFIVALDGRFLDANVAGIRLLAAGSLEAVLNSSVCDVSEDLSESQGVLATLRREGELAMDELMLRRLDGTVIWVAVSCTLAHSATDEGHVILTTAVDITARKQSEDAAISRLRQSERDYRALFEHAHDPIVVLEPWSEIVLDANHAACATYGLEKRAFLGRSMREFSRPRTIERTGEVMEANGRFINFETEQVRADGTPLPLLVTAGAVMYRGQPAILSINRDMTDLRRAEHQRREAYERISAIAREWATTFDAVPHPILLLDEDVRIRRANRAAAELFDRDILDLPGLALESLATEPWITIASLCREGADVSREVRGMDGERIWDVSVTMQQGEVSGTVVFLRDVTGMHELQDTLLRAETMSAMGSLVAGVLHEVRNPLFSISAAVDTLEIRLGATENQKYVDRVRTDLRRLQKVMSDLLEYGKPQAISVRAVALKDLLASAKAACSVLAASSGIAIEVDPTDVILAVDPDRMRQVFQNLLDNAIQHSSDGGIVRVSARTDTHKGHAVVHVSVEDAGAGFAPADLPQIFKPFFTKRRGGTGLGLAIVQRLVEAHGGTVEATNGPDGGAIVTVSLRL
jgi:PAS domain S-box-containing protein